MVRTKADIGSTRVSAAKAPRKVTGGGSAGTCSSPAGKGSSKDRLSGGNSYNPQPTPTWQKGISSFLKASTIDSSQESNSSDSLSGSCAGSGASSSSTGCDKPSTNCSAMPSTICSAKPSTSSIANPSRSSRDNPTTSSSDKPSTSGSDK